MSLDVFLTLGIIAIVVIIGWGADRHWREENHQHWHDRNGIEPMSDEDMAINAELAKRRAK